MYSYRTYLGHGQNLQQGHGGLSLWYRRCVVTMSGLSYSPDAFSNVSKISEKTCIYTAAVNQNIFKELLKDSVEVNNALYSKANVICLRE